MGQRTRKANINKCISLSALQLKDVKTIPVKHPEKVRFLKIYKIPLPEDPELNHVAQMIQLITANTVGLTLQYGIFIRLVHTAQYEKLGGIRNFFNQYLTECIKFGYPNAPLEQEAINKSKLIIM